jgi:sugar (pentulose or hexulose) kinase
MTTADTILAIDSGTSRTKAALFDLAGNSLGIASQDMLVLHPFDGACEMDMHAVWDAVCAVCKELAQRFPEEWKNLRGVAVTAQGDGLWPLDANGEPLGNAMLWNDNRVKRLELHNEEEITRYGIDNALCPLFAGAVPMLMRWMQDFEAQRFEKLAHVLHCKDWLVYKLTGEIITDRTDASTAMLNILTNKYEFDLLPLMGMPREKATVFPQFVESTTTVGQTGTLVFSACALPAGLPVIAGALDVVASTYGSGARQTGDAVSILGTTLSNQVIIDASQVSHEDVAGSTLGFITPNTFMRILASTNGAGTVDWAREVLSPGRGYDELEAELEEKIPAGSEGLFFLPYLNGERAPFRDTRATASFAGLNIQHNRLHMLRSVYEGLAYGMRDCHAHLPQGDSPINLCGGASRSNFLSQLCADVLGRPTRSIPKREFGLLGMAMAWMAGMGLPLPDISKAAESKLYSPREELTAIYDEGYAVFKELRQASQAFWQQRDQFIYRLDQD